MQCMPQTILAQKNNIIIIIKVRFLLLTSPSVLAHFGISMFNFCIHNVTNGKVQHQYLLPFTKQDKVIK